MVNLITLFDKDVTILLIEAKFISWLTEIFLF